MIGLFIKGIELPPKGYFLCLEITCEGEVYCYDREDASVAKAVNVRTREDALKILAECEEMRWTDEQP